MKVLIFKRGGRGEHVVDGIAEHGRDMDIRAVEVPEDLPPIIDEPEDYIEIPSDFEPDIILDYIYQNELSHYLVEMAGKNDIPVIVPGRKVGDSISPRTCCTLSLSLVKGDKVPAALKEYADIFGTPDIDISIDNEGKVEKITVNRGSPCGSTWDAAEKVIGLPVDEAYNRFGLEIQYNCRAPTGYDAVLVRKAPLHIAAEAHGRAFKEAVARASKVPEGEDLEVAPEDG